MIDEPRTTEEFVDALIAERGGRDRFSAVQVRIAHAVATALRDPAEIDPGIVSRLLDLLPPRAFVPDPVKPVGHIVFTDGFSHELGRAIDACKADDDVGRLALTMAEARIRELEAEAKAKDTTIADLRRDLEQAHARLSDLATPVSSYDADVVPFVPSGAGRSSMPSRQYAPRRISDAHSLSVVRI
jgi:hypothetical protein